jgi:predicted TIM-barrel enzyme
LIEGAAAQASRYRRQLGAQNVRIFADAHVKHGAHAIVQDRSIAELVRDVEFFNADVVIATGQRTGHAADLDYLKAIRAAASLPTLVGSGATPDNVGDILSIVDGVIVASAVKVDGCWWNPVDAERAKLFVPRARS